jgi:hypothetical protein
MLFFLAFHFSLSLTPNCRNWSPNYSVLVLNRIANVLKNWPRKFETFCPLFRAQIRLNPLYQWPLQPREAYFPLLTSTGMTSAQSSSKSFGRKFFKVLHQLKVLQSSSKSFGRKRRLQRHITTRSEYRNKQASRQKFKFVFGVFFAPF